MESLNNSNKLEFFRLSPYSANIVAQGSEGIGPCSQIGITLHKVKIVAGGSEVYFALLVPPSLLSKSELPGGTLLGPAPSPSSPLPSSREGGGLAVSRRLVETLLGTVVTTTENRCLSASSKNTSELVSAKYLR